MHRVRAGHSSLLLRDSRSMPAEDFDVEWHLGSEYHFHVGEDPVPRFHRLESEVTQQESQHNLDFSQSKALTDAVPGTYSVCVTARHRENMGLTLASEAMQRD